MNVPVPCPESDLLRAILRGSVSPDDEERISHHLESCDQCRRTVDAIAGFGPGEATLGESDFDVDKPSSVPMELPAAVDQSLAPNLRAVMDQLKEDDSPGRGASATEATDGGTRSLPSGMDAFIQRLVEDTEPGQPAKIGHYELGERIGRGAMGAVYRARDQKLGRDVAIKFLKPDLTRDGTFVERFVREAQAAAGIAHRNVITVHSIEETNGVPWIVMELVEGDSLRKRLRRMGPLTLTSVARIGSQIAEGLQAAHEKRLVHRDIKPSNIVLVEDTDEVRITDFGLAQLEGATRLTKSGLLMGTPKYMAPEQARGEKTDHRSDLFSLGGVLYAMCVGQAPFSGKNDAEVVSNVAMHRLNPIEQVDPTLPRWLINLINKLLAKNPQDRFQSAREVAIILRRNLEASDFADLPNDGGWDEATAVEASPAFYRDAAETLVEDAVPGDEMPTAMTAPMIDTSIPPGTTVSRAAHAAAWKKSQNIVIAAGLLLLCLLVPILAGWFEGDPQPDGGGEVTPGGQTAQGPTGNLDEDILGPFTRPLPEFGDGPFVLEQDGKRFRFIDLPLANQQARDGDLIFLEFDGEREIPQLLIRRRITLAAGWNRDEDRPFRPVLKRDLFDFGIGNRFLVSIGTPVRMEGIEIRFESEFDEEQRKELTLVELLEWAIVCEEAGRLELVNCRFRMQPGGPTQIAVKADKGSAGVFVKNCEFFGGSALALAGPQMATAENSVFVCSNSFVILQQTGPGGTVEVKNCTCINENFLQVNIGRRPPGGAKESRVRMEVRDCILDSTGSLVAAKQLAAAARLFPIDGGKFDIASTIAWNGQANVYDVGTFVSFLNIAESPPKLYSLAPENVAEWQGKWRGWERDGRAGKYFPAAGCGGYHERLLELEHSRQLEPNLDGNLPPAQLGAHTGEAGPGDGYLRFLDRSPPR